MAAQPAKLAGLEGRKGAIAAGYDADLVVFDTDAEFSLTTADLYYRHPVSPYLGERLQGRVRATFVRGVAVFEDGAFPDPPIGRELRLQEKLAQA
jgi:allantoinase